VTQAQRETLELFVRCYPFGGTEHLVEPVRALLRDHARLQAERDNYEATARDMANNAEFWRGLVLRSGEVFGVEAKTCDDGTINETVLAVKVPELVERDHAELLALREAAEEVLVDPWGETFRKLRAALNRSER